MSDGSVRIDDLRDGEAFELRTIAGTVKTGYARLDRTDSEWFYFDVEPDLNLARVQRGAVVSVTRRRPGGRSAVRTFAPPSHPLAPQDPRRKAITKRNT